MHQAHGVVVAAIAVTGVAIRKTDVAGEVLLPGMFVTVATWIAAHYALARAITPGQLVTFYAYASFLALPLATLTEAADKIVRGHVGAGRVIAILRARFVEPPSLAQISREAGCSAFYLSRTFSQEMGMTIPQYLRQIRMERAAALLRAGTHNVTEAAMEVGYNSLSHFSAGFHELFGCCPGLYPLRTPTQKSLGSAANR